MNLAPYGAVTAANIALYARQTLDHVRAAPSCGEVEIEVALPGADLVVRLQEGRLAEAVRRCFIACAASEPAPRDRIDIRVVHPELHSGSKPWAWGTEHYRDHTLAEILGPLGLRAAHFHDLDHWYLYDANALFGVQQMRGPEDYPPWDVGAPLRPFLHWYYAQRGLRLGHAGTLGLEGQGVLLAGAGGAGKSGTVLAGLLNGLDSVGDDYVILDARDDVRARPLFSTLKQDPAGFERLGLRTRLPFASALNWQGKYQFHIADVAARTMPPELRVKALLLPSIRSSSRTYITRVHRRDALIPLASSSIYQMPGERESGFRFFSGVVNRLQCYRLDLGTEPGEIAGRIAQFLRDGHED